MLPEVGAMDLTSSGKLQPGSLLASRYRIESVLGQGGMGAVYLARVEALDKAVAIKEMRVHADDQRHRQQAVEQFRNEAHFLAKLDHPNLVGVTDYFDEGGRHYLVMAYVQGQDLSQQIKARQAAFPVAQVLEWALQLTSVLEYLHRQEPPIIFRDLKPSNIMLDSANRIRLVDFGIARTANPDQSTVTFLHGVGSLGYAPPEQHLGAGGTDRRSDIYSLGATLFHLLTNQIPASPGELISRGAGPGSARLLNPEVPPALDSAIMVMMALAKEDRFQQASQVHEVLERIAASLPTADSTEHLGSTQGLPLIRDHAYLSHGDQHFPIEFADIIVGRQAPAQVILSYPQISREHLRLARTSKGYTVVDLGSRFGTFLNGQPVGDQPMPLQDSDELVLGGVLSLKFFDPSQTQGGKRVGRLKGVWIDPDSQEVWLDGQQLSPPLSPAQLTLLKLLEQRLGAFVSRDDIVKAVWPEAASEGVSEEAIDGLIKRVRGRLREAGRDPIEVRRGQGLRLT